jgi:hypothetical protein
MRMIRGWTLAAGACLLLLVCATPAVQGEEDPLAVPAERLVHARAKMDAAIRVKDKLKLREALGDLRIAQALFEKRERNPEGLSKGLQARVKTALEEIADRVKWCRVLLDEFDAQREGWDPDQERPPYESGGADEPRPVAKPPTDAELDAELPPIAGGQSKSSWARKVADIYRATPAPGKRALLARGMALRAGEQALPELYRLFDSESDAVAREGVHQALVDVGGKRVARRMATYARKTAESRYEQALDVICRSLARPEKEEPERPFQQAVREFHKLKNRKLSLRIIETLDAMSHEGVAALGEVIYVPDFGYHDHVIELLATKQDGRAVPPLVYKMNRFRFEYRVQMPAHKALLQLGWYAVPQLVEALDDRAAGIWISWTLRKITGETMGTDRRKWRDWWVNERVRHPELFDDPEERPITPKR